MKHTRLTPRDGLPELESSANLAWREGWWQAAPVFFVLGVAVAVILLKA